MMISVMVRMGVEELEVENGVLSVRAEGRGCACKVNAGNARF